MILYVVFIDMRVDKLWQNYIIGLIIPAWISASTEMRFLIE